MRLIRLVIFIIVFVAAMSLGVASAAAESTALCNTDEGSGAHELCKFGHEISHVHTATLSGQKARLLTALQNNRIYHVHYATLSGAKAKILTSFLTVECDVSFLGNAFEAEGSVIGHLTYTNCGSCSVSETSKEAIIELEKLSHEFADLTFEFEIHAVCGSSLDCTYNGEGLVGKANGPLLASEKNGSITVENQAVKKLGGFLCPKSTKLDLTATPEEATYITGDNETFTTLCKEDPGTGAGEVCPEGKAIPVECDVLFLGDVESTLGSPLVISGKFTYSSCSSECSVTEENGPSIIEVLKLGHELADVTGEGRMHVVCGEVLDCIYKGEGLAGHSLGPLLVEAGGSENGEIRLEGQETKKVAGGLLCPKTSKLDLLTHPLTTTYITE